jgi:hypothetical protein
VADDLSASGFSDLPHPAKTKIKSNPASRMIEILFIENSFLLYPSGNIQNSSTQFEMDCQAKDASGGTVICFY